ncbi:TIGR02444 family protein [Shewanella xiamenensis]|uniref:TIGR02444 family protein n=1 Tax=Shewanella xiamenensis TaxID=332186 RepID=UPI00255A72EC|nr:TIGR02444 family protein [Shewanella xiamenensis]MDL3986798.1 TIGR02444 family protein [Shewanella xiamenensis]
MSDVTPLDSQIWHWCDMSYGQNKVLCLELQDNCQVNVNLLLLAQYLDLTSDVAGPREYSTEQWQQLVNAVREWDEKFLTPYRRLRRLAKASLNAAEYQQMLDVELMMERKAQRTILHTVNDLSPSGQQTNLVSYLALFGLSAADVIALDLIAP